MCIKCTWEYAYHNASKSEANVRVLVVIRLRKSMHTDLKYPYVSTRSDGFCEILALNYAPGAAAPGTAAPGAAAPGA